MKTPKELDVLRRAAWFEDSPEIVEAMRADGKNEWARHLHRMNIYQKNLIAEIRKLRRELQALHKENQ
jgi:hypothetical protein